MLPHEAFPGPRIDYLGEVIRFFDYWLKGIDNGVMDEPAVTVYVQEHQKPEAVPGDWSGYWRTETEWPRPDATLRSLYLGPDNRLLEEAEVRERPLEEGSDSFEYDPTWAPAAASGAGSRPPISGRTIADPSRTKRRPCGKPWRSSENPGWKWAFPRRHPSPVYPLTW